VREKGEGIAPRGDSGQVGVGRKVKGAESGYSGLVTG